MKQLNILGHKGKNKDQFQIEIQFTENEKISSKNIDFSTMPGFEDFINKLSWYYKDYLLNPYGKEYKSAQLINKNINKSLESCGTFERIV
jgi:hypothetical protein